MLFTVNKMSKFGKLLNRFYRMALSENKSDLIPILIILPSVNIGDRI